MRRSGRRGGGEFGEDGLRIRRGGEGALPPWREGFGGVGGRDEMGGLLR